VIAWPIRAQGCRTASRPAIAPMSPSSMLRLSADRATFERPTTLAAEIEDVFVNGRPVWREGKPTGERPGRQLDRQQWQAEAR
jgi:hypothetical protein